MKCNLESEKKMNRNYVRGRAKEYRLRNKYQKQGYMCYRTAGSHGTADLICIHPLKKEILFIQSKPKNYPAKATQRLLAGNNWLNDTFKGEFRVE